MIPKEEKVKKYETVLEAAFQLVEAQEEEDKTFGNEPESVAKEAAAKTHAVWKDLKEAVGALKEYREAGEPVFILRGQDMAAGKTIYAWGIFAEHIGALPEMTCYASKKSREIEGWQEAHPKMTKIPD